MTRFLRDAWYVAGWASELKEDAQLTRQLLDEPVLMFRDSAGQVVALEDRCPHRFAPLSMGKRIGDVIACPYHGLRFDSTGACVHNPHGAGRIPSAARVKKFTVVERDLLLWIWMGRPEAADPTLIPDGGFLVSTDYHAETGDHLLLGCHYELATDNLMDLSHAVFVHEKTFGTPDAVKGKLTVRQEGPVITANIWVADCMPAGPAFPLAGPDNPVDHWLDMEWRPASNMTLRVGATLPGRPRSEGVEGLALHFLTPESERTTHYFFANAMLKRHAAMLPRPTQPLPTQRFVFETEDEPILHAIQNRMKSTDLWAHDPVLLPNDAGAVRVRRFLQGLIEEEAARNDEEAPASEKPERLSANLPG